uniref:Protein kinase domain-containing protein n=1 Tax=Amphimedon queenslandica TaxID=400682 RepID=A0A1X7T698_AMPQE
MKLKSCEPEISSQGLISHLCYWRATSVSRGSLWNQQQGLTDDHWVIDKDEATLTKEELGRRFYAVVTVGIFRGLRVAVKSLHYIIISDFNLALFSREMSIAPRVCHPNLVQFLD